MLKEWLIFLVITGFTEVWFIDNLHWNNSILFLQYIEIELNLITGQYKVYRQQSYFRPVGDIAVRC